LEGSALQLLQESRPNQRQASDSVHVRLSNHMEQSMTVADDAT